MSKRLKELGKVMARCNERINNCNRAIERYTEELKENPAHAFKWVDGKFGVAAEWRAAHLILDMAETAAADEAGKTVAEIRADIQKMICRDAKSVTPSSTSTGSNYMDAANLEALADSLDSLSGLLGPIRLSG